MNVQQGWSCRLILEKMKEWRVQYGSEELFMETQVCNGHVELLASNGTNYKKQQVHKCIVEHLIGQDKLGNSDNV